MQVCYFCYFLGKKNYYKHIIIHFTGRGTDDRIRYNRPAGMWMFSLCNHFDMSAAEHVTVASLANLHTCELNDGFSTPCTNCDAFTQNAFYICIHSAKCRLISYKC